MLEDQIEAAAAERSPATAHAAMLEALVTGEGLDRVAAIAAEHTGAPIRILVPRAGSDGSQGSPAERFIAALVAGGDPAQPAEVAALAPIVSNGELQGAVVMLAEGNEQAEEYLGVAAVAALTGIAMMNARDDAARSLGGSLLSDLLTRSDVRPGDVGRRAATLGCDLREGLVALCLDPAGARPGLPTATVLAEFPGALVERVGERIYALLPAGEEAGALAARLRELGAPAAISSRYGQAGDARLALEEAELLLDVGGGTSGVGASADRVFRLLFRLFASHPDELRRFCDETIGALVRHDEEFASELLVTLDAYRQHDCNMNLTAKATFTHRHTVSNRLARIHELTGLDPFGSEDRALLGLALKAR